MLSYCMSLPEESCIDGSLRGAELNDLGTTYKNYDIQLSRHAPLSGRSPLGICQICTLHSPFQMPRSSSKTPVGTPRLVYFLPESLLNVHPPYRTSKLEGKRPHSLAASCSWCRVKGLRLNPSQEDAARRQNVRRCGLGLLKGLGPWVRKPK